MYNFKVLSSPVRAMQINRSGEVIMDDKKLCGDVGYWVVISDAGEQTVWSDEEFRKNFEPADAPATEYLRQAIKK